MGRNGNEATFEETMNENLQNWKKLHEFFDQYATLQCKEIIKKQEENKRRKPHRHNILKMQNIKDEENKF